jgi:hypothetical protein
MEVEDLKSIREHGWECNLVMYVLGQKDPEKKKKGMLKVNINIVCGWKSKGSQEWNWLEKCSGRK